MGTGDIAEQTLQMGLDMYLIAKCYVGAKHDHRNVKGVIDITVGDKKLPIDFNILTWMRAIGARQTISTITL